MELALLGAEEVSRDLQRSLATSICLLVYDNGLAGRLPISAILSQSNDGNSEKLRGEREAGMCKSKKKTTSEKLGEETPEHLKRDNPSVQADGLQVLISLPTAVILVTVL